MFRQKAFRESLFQLIFVAPWVIMFHMSYLFLNLQQCSGSLLAWFRIVLVYYFYCVAAVMAYFPCRVDLLKRIFDGRTTLIPEFLILLNVMTTILTGIILFIGLWISYLIDHDCPQLYMITRFHFFFHMVEFGMAICLCSCFCIMNLNTFLRNFAPRTWILYYMNP